MATSEKKKWDQDVMSAADYEKTLEYQKVYEKANENYRKAVEDGDEDTAQQYRRIMEHAHTQTEQLRAQYGYSGGGDGSQFIPLTGQTTRVDTGVKDNSDYLEQMYEAKKQQNLAKLKQAYEENLHAIDRAGQGLEQTYQAARNQTAGTAEQEKRNFAEYANANGLNNGTAGQAQLARSVALQHDLNALHTQQAGAEADLRQRRADAETEYNSAIAQAEATGAYDLAAALYKEKVRVQDALMDAEIQQRQDALKQFQLQYQAYRDRVEDNQWQSEQDFKAQQYADKLKQEQAKAEAEPKGETETKAETPTADYEGLFAAAMASGYPRSFIANRYKDFGFNSATGLYEEYSNWAVKDVIPEPYEPDNAVKPDASLGRGYWEIVNQLSALEDSPGDITERVLRIIIDGVKSGKLTQAGEEKLLEQYGL